MRQDLYTSRYSPLERGALKTCIIGGLLAAMLCTCEARGTERVETLADCDRIQQKYGGAGVLVATVKITCTSSTKPNENCRTRSNPKGYPTGKTYCVWRPSNRPSWAN